MAFSRSDDGEFIPAFEAVQFDSEDRALGSARVLADKHVGVLAWLREADHNIGEYAPPTVQFQAGKVQDME